MPLTGVGKVFKPQLRRDAAARVLTRSLSALAENGIDCSVQVGPHGSHGSMATVTVVHIPEQEHDAVSEKIRSTLAPFVLRHEIAFK